MTFNFENTVPKKKRAMTLRAPVPTQQTPPEEEKFPKLQQAFGHGGTMEIFHSDEPTDETGDQGGGENSNIDTPFGETTQLVGGTGGQIEGSTSAGTTGPATEKTSVGDPSSQSYTPWKQYQTANKEGFEKFGSQVVGNFKQDSRQLRSEAQNTSDQYLGQGSDLANQVQVVSGGKGNIDNLLDKVDSGQSLSTQEQELWNNFQNPKNINFSTPQFSEQKQRAKSLIEKGKNLSSSAGLSREIQKAAGPKGSWGGANFDARGVQQSKVGQQNIADAKNNTSGLNSMFPQLQREIQTAQGLIKKGTPEISNYTQEAGQERLNNLDNKMSSQAQQFYSTITKSLGKDGDFTLTPDNAARLGLQEGDSLWGLDLSAIFDPNSSSFQSGMKTERELQIENNLRNLIGQAMNTNPQSIGGIIKKAAEAKRIEYQNTIKRPTQHRDHFTAINRAVAKFLRGDRSEEQLLRNHYAPQTGGGNNIVPLSSKHKRSGYAGSIFRDLNMSGGNAATIGHLKNTYNFWNNHYNRIRNNHGIGKTVKIQGGQV